jgi:hypothetical protein
LCIVLTSQIACSIQLGTPTDRSTESESSSSDTTDSTAPTAANSVTEEAADIDIDYDDSITWYWAAGSDADSGIASYQLYTFPSASLADCGVSTTGGTLQYTGTDTNSGAITGFSAGETYYGAVLTTNTSGLTAWSTCSDGVQYKTYPVAADDSSTTAEITGTTFSLISNDSDADGDAISVTSVDTGAVSYGTLVDNGDGTVTYTPDADYAGTESFTYVLTDSDGNTDTGTVTVRTTSDYEWDGSSGDGNWNTSANWRGNSVPGNTDIAYFYDAACGSNCSVTIDNPGADVLGIRMQSDFSGTITQAAGQPVTVGSKFYMQRSGTFTGSNGALSFNEFSLYGGTFTSTSGTLNVGYYIGSTSNTDGFIISDGATFNHSNGTLEFDFSVRGNCAHDKAFTSDIASGVTFYNLVLDIYNNPVCGTTQAWWYGVASHPTVVVENDLTMRSGGLKEGSTIHIDVYGNLIAECAQLATPTDCAIGGDTRRITLKGTGNQTYDIATDARLPVLSIDKTGGTVTPTGSGLMRANIFELLNGSFTAPSSTFTIARWAAGSTRSDGFYLEAGTTFNHNNGLILFDAGIQRSAAGTALRLTNNSGDSFYDVIIDVEDTSVGGGGYNGGGFYINGTFNPIVEGNLELHNGYFTGNNFQLYGDFTTECDIPADMEDCASLVDGIDLVGSNAQVLTLAAGTDARPDLVINKDNPGDTVTLASDWDLSSATDSDLTITQGTLVLGAFNLSLSDDLVVDAAGDITCTTGGWTAAGTSSGAGIGGLSCP